MGDVHKNALQVEFDNRIKLKFYGAAVTSNTGLAAYRELDEDVILVLERPGGGVGRTSYGKCRF